MNKETEEEFRQQLGAVTAKVEDIASLVAKINELGEKQLNSMHRMNDLLKTFAATVTRTQLHLLELTLVVKTIHFYNPLSDKEAASDLDRKIDELWEKTFAETKQFSSENLDSHVVPDHTE